MTACRNAGVAPVADETMKRYKSHCRQIGKGENRYCYRYRDDEVDLVVKEYPSDVKDYMIQREVAAMKQLEHICGVQHVFGFHEASRAVVTRYAGKSLDEYIKKKGITSEKLAQIMYHVIHTVRKMGEYYTLHNNITARNVCVKKIGKGKLKVTLIDFALSCEGGQPHRPHLLTQKEKEGLGK